MMQTRVGKLLKMVEIMIIRTTIIKLLIKLLIIKQ